MTPGRRPDDPDQPSAWRAGTVRGFGPNRPAPRCPANCRRESESLSGHRRRQISTHCTPDHRPGRGTRFPAMPARRQGGSRSPHTEQSHDAADRGCPRLLLRAGGPPAVLAPVVVPADAVLVVGRVTPSPAPSTRSAAKRGQSSVGLSFQCPAIPTAPPVGRRGCGSGVGLSRPPHLTRSWCCRAERASASTGARPPCWASVETIWAGWVTVLASRLTVLVGPVRLLS